MLGMRPKWSTPTGVVYSPHARLTLMELVKLLTPATGVHCVVENAPRGE